MVWGLKSFFISIWRGMRAITLFPPPLSYEDIKKEAGEIEQKTDDHIEKKRDLD